MTKPRMIVSLGLVSYDDRFVVVYLPKMGIQELDGG